jgi:hypothetical protein
MHRFIRRLASAICLLRMTSRTRETLDDAVLQVR